MNRAIRSLASGISRCVREEVGSTYIVKEHEIVGQGHSCARRIRCCC
jgi:hypothetical protein